jgi:uridine kinase/ribulose-5-phosphate 4-epimerase/fuculose-1-phosphate aldolase
MIMKPMLISISGSSGVGKTTLAHLICAVFGDEQCLHISGDDLHRWERSDPMWNTYTHLNPSANDLEAGYRDLYDLIRGTLINRRVYNHETGKFDPLVVIAPKPIIVYEGLHAFYNDRTSEIADVRIYVDIDNELKTEWKLKRDTKKRGYTKDQVITTMERRREDERLFIIPQKDKADVVVKFIKNRNQSVSMEFVCVTDRGYSVVSSVKQFYDSMMNFIDVCKWLSMDPSLVQGRGGNVSVKFDTGMVVTSSGSMMGEVSMNRGYCVCDTIPSCNTYADESSYMQSILQKKKHGYGIPSMETGFHANIKNKIVVHTHPIHVNAILCSLEARETIASLFKDLSYKFVEYISPGFELVNRLSTDCSVIFLQNHGLVISASSAEEAMELTEKINNRCKRWLGNHAEPFIHGDTETISMPLFPDSAVFRDEMSVINSYILHLMQYACLTPNFLSDTEVTKLNELKSEVYRRLINDAISESCV